MPQVMNTFASKAPENAMHLLHTRSLHAMTAAIQDHAAKVPHGFLPNSAIHCAHLRSRSKKGIRHAAKWQQ